MINQIRNNEQRTRTWTKASSEQEQEQRKVQMPSVACSLQLVWFAVCGLRIVALKIAASTYRNKHHTRPHSHTDRERATHRHTQRDTRTDRETRPFLQKPKRFLSFRICQTASSSSSTCSSQFQTHPSLAAQSYTFKLRTAGVWPRVAKWDSTFSRIPLIACVL